MMGKIFVNPISCPIKIPPNKVMINKANKPNPFVSIGWPERWISLGKTLVPKIKVKIPIGILIQKI